MSDIRPTPDAGTDPENPEVPEAPAHADIDPEAVVDELDIDREAVVDELDAADEVGEYEEESTGAEDPYEQLLGVEDEISDSEE